MMTAYIVLLENKPVQPALRAAVTCDLQSEETEATQSMAVLVG